jgi:uncharacterized protein YqjF (DUF2071 family)
MNTTTQQSSEPVAGYQTWKHLLFLHWRVDAEQLQPLVPAPLTIQQYDGSAWLGVIPFSMQRVRPWWSPAVPGVSWFLETNVRTYVTHPNGTSAVWFFNLDANSRLAVAVARRFWHLNYSFARMNLDLTDSSTSYRGQRMNNTTATYDISCRRQTPAPLNTAEQGTIEHFLLERYLLFAEDNRGQLRSAEVHHVPYEFSVNLDVDCRHSLFQPLGLQGLQDQAPDHAAYSPGVDVTVSSLKKITANPVDSRTALP